MHQNICKRIGEAKAMAIIMNTPITPNNCGMCQSWSGIHHAIPYTVGPNYSYHNIRHYVDLDESYENK